MMDRSRGVDGVLWVLGRVGSRLDDVAYAC